MTLFSQITSGNTVDTPVDQAAVADQTVDQTTGLENLQEVVTSRVAPPKTYLVLTALEQMSKCDRKVQTLQQAIQQADMVSNVTNVVKTHSLSAPLVEMMQVVPGFTNAVTAFPEASQYDVVPAAPTSHKLTEGLESLGSALTETTDQIRAKTSDVVTSFTQMIDGLEGAVDVLQTQVQNDRAALESSDLTDEVLAILPVVSMSNSDLTALLDTITSQVAVIQPANVDALRANPETIPAEITTLQSFTQEFGQTLGLETFALGLTRADKDARFEASAGSFGDKGFTKTDVTLMLDKADSLLGSVKTVIENKAELVTALEQAAADFPEALSSTDVVYGAFEHATLLSCYATLNTALLREAVNVTASVLQMTDAALNIDDGLSA